MKISVFKTLPAVEYTEVFDQCCYCDVTASFYEPKDIRLLMGVWQSLLCLLSASISVSKEEKQEQEKKQKKQYIRTWRNLTFVSGKCCSN